MNFQRRFVRPRENLVFKSSGKSVMICTAEKFCL